MRNLKSIYALFFLILFCYSKSSNGQGIYRFNNDLPLISASFIKESLIIEPEATFFNVVVVKNLGNTTEDVTLNFNVPLGWSVMVSENRSYKLEPGDSIIVPLRAAPSKTVEGEIGYSIIASVNDKRGETLANAYSFVKIPRKTDLMIRPLTRVSLFDQVTGEAEISFIVSNRGNVNELVFLVFESSANVALPNERENISSIDLMVKARSDTTISFRARRIDDTNFQNNILYRIDMKATSQEKVFNTSFWFDNLSNIERYRIPDSEKVLVVDLAAQNLLSGRQTYLVGGFRGNLLFPQKRTFSYNFYKYGTEMDLLRYSRMRFEYSTPRYNFMLGDIMGFPIRNGFGKGAMLTLKANDYLKASVLAGRNPFRAIDNYGVMLEENATPFRFSPRYSYSHNRYSNSIAQTYGLGSSLHLFSRHRIHANMGMSSVDLLSIGETETGYGLTLDYDGRVNNTRLRIREQYGSRSYYGTFAGRHELMARVTQPLNETLQVDFILNDRSYKPVIETLEGSISDKYQNNTEAKFITRKIFDRNFSVYGGPVYQRKSTNSFYLYDNVTPFSSHSAKLNVGTRLRDGLGTTFTPSATFGYTFVTGFSELPPDMNRSINSNKNFFSAHMSINLRRTFWGTYVNYFYGPYSVNQEITQYYYGITANSIRIMPYYDKYIYKDMLKLSSKVSLMHDFAFKTTRFIFNNQLDMYLKNDYTISLLNTFSHQITNDRVTEDKYSYSNNYFELRLRKEFNWNQPRIKYYDLEINIFKDLNGNLSRQFNEPGVKDVLVTITSIDPIAYGSYDIDYEPSPAMVSTRLLTSIDGKIQYKNLARGLYKIELQSVGNDQAKYFPDQNEFTINVTADQTVFIPYLERNKIFGRVILNRSRLTTLGRIEPSNIKITATDSKGRQTSALSDANGFFEMYVPSVDSYVVNINNIFRDHFTLRQNDFRANLNGFKQFEVNFVFDEIRRQIEFTPSNTETVTEVRRVGRTNLNGTVRDAATLQPLRAQIEIVANANGSTIRQFNTDRTTGHFTNSFATGEDFMLVVSANGYWMHSERLILDPNLTIQDVERDILLESITIGARFQLNNMRFTSGSVVIPTEALPELDRLVNQLKLNPNVKIRIEGHSDALETLNNPTLSMQRAETIMKYMVQHGFSNIEFTGLRDSRPLAPSDNEDNRRRNRRVEIIVIDR
jgi:outer membrane protein OmpA-like peptidoglycan-associated protein